MDGAAPLMFADLAPAGVSSVRVAPAPRSMLAQRGGGGIAGAGAGAGPGANGSFPSFATSQRVAYGAAPPPPQRAGSATALGGAGRAAYAPGHFNQTQGAFVPAQFGTPNAQQQQQQQQQQQGLDARGPDAEAAVAVAAASGSPPPQDWAKFDDDSAVAPRRAAAPFAPAPRPPP